jgi:hypothetical protein
MMNSMKYVNITVNKEIPQNYQLLQCGQSWNINRWSQGQDAYVWHSAYMQQVSMKKGQDSYWEPGSTFITSKLLIAISKPVFVKSSADAGDSVAEAMDKMLGFVSKTYRACLELRICDYISILLHKTWSPCINVHPEINFNLQEYKY